MNAQTLTTETKEKIKRGTLNTLFTKLKERHLEVFEKKIFLKRVEIYANDRQASMFLSMHYFSMGDISVIDKFCKDKKFEMYNFSTHPSVDGSLHVYFSFAIKSEYIDIVLSKK